MSEVAEILQAIESYCAANGIAESTFGRQAVNDGKLVSRLREGGTLTLPTHEKVLEFLTRPAARREQAA